MRIPSDPDGATGPFSDLLRLQTDFYTRLNEETLRYLHRLQGAVAPAVPGTVLMPGAAVELGATGDPGATVELKLDVENRQRVHCVVTPMVSPLVALSGVTWFPVTEAHPPAALLAPEEVATLEIKVLVPATIPPGVYRGALLLQGFREGALAMSIAVADGKHAESVAAATADAPPATPTTKPRRSRKAAKTS